VLPSRLPEPRAAAHRIEPPLSAAKATDPFAWHGSGSVTMNCDFEHRRSAATAARATAASASTAVFWALFAPMYARSAGTDSSVPLVSAAGNPSVVIVGEQASPLSVVEPFTPTTVVGAADIAQTPGADQANSLKMITNFVPGAYIVHDQLHVRGGHQVTWAIDGVDIPNTNIGSNLGPQIDPKDIEQLEAERGGYGAAQGDRTYGIFNIVPQTGFTRDDQAELLASGGNYGTANGYLSVGSHSDRFAYYASVSGNRSDLGIEPPVAQVIHDSSNGYGAFTTLIFDATPTDQLRFVGSARRDDYEIPVFPGEEANDVQHETDAFGILSWVRSLGAARLSGTAEPPEAGSASAPGGTLTTALFYHFNRVDLEGGPEDFPISTTDQHTSNYVGGQESLQFGWSRNVLEVGLYGFAQWDDQRFGLIFNDGSNPPVEQTSSPSGSLFAAYLQDTFRAAHWLTLSAGIRQTHFSGEVVENATDPRIGATVLLPRLDWVLRAFYGEYYQAPPLDTLSGPLLQYATASDLAFLPLRGEGGWSIDTNYFHMRARNFFDHNPLGNSNVFLPLTIDGALIRGTELTVRSPRLWDTVQARLAWSNQTADGFGAVSGGLTDFSPPAGYFALDHDQRNTLNAGLDAQLPWQTFASMNLYYGSGFSNGDPPPSHLPSNTSIDMTIGKAFSERFTASLTVLNLTDQRLLLDNSLTFGGTHFNYPRTVYAEIHYRFGY
jgi:TonB-dependent receptor-like protein